MSPRLSPVAAAAPSQLAAASTSPARALPLGECHLRAEAQGGLARLTLEQTFENPHDEALHVTYVLPLPHEAAVSGFAFVIGDRTIEGEIDTKSKARERFEDALASGHTAALLEEERSTVFTQELGNIPPRTRVTARITLDAPLLYVGHGAHAAHARGQWELRFPLTVAPRYLGEAGRVPDAERLAVTVREVSAETPRVALSLVVRDALPEGRSPESPSHALQCAGARAERGEAFAVSFGGADGRAPLDRDVVVRWDATTGAAHATAAVHVAEAEDAAYALVTVVPPGAAPGAGPEHPRDLTVLLDTSGSMGGEPLEQAKRVAKALVSSLRESDRVHLVEFSNDTRSFLPAAADATADTKKAALAWLSKLRASGGTEMRTGILRALRDVRPGRHAQVVLVTDGLIGFEQEIVEAIFRDNAHAARVHTVGVGSAVNRSLLAPAARAGRGVEILCGVGEDVEPLVARLLARTTAPLVTDLTVKRAVPAGDLEVACAIERLPDLYAGAPVLIPVRLPREGGALVLAGRTADGVFRQEIPVVADGVARPHVRALYGREAVLDVDLRLAAGAYASAREADAEVERLGLAYGISTRKTSFVAVDTTRAVDPTAPTRRETIAQALPFGMTAEAVGAALRPASATLPVVQAQRGRLSETSTRAGRISPSSEGGAPPAQGARPKRAVPPAPAPAAPMRPEAKVADEETRAPRQADEKRKAAKKEAPSLLERAVRAVFGEPEREEADGAADALAASADAPAPMGGAVGEGGRGGSVRELTGRLTLLAGGAVSVELTLTEELELTHGALWLQLADGTRVEGFLDPTRSTAPGTYGAGRVVRLVCALAGGRVLTRGEAVTLTLAPDAPSGALVIRLS
ncbi:MAG TPA: VIT domain-containing protein [Polyangiaceae bacterium]|nr:VIT domain-containing protein [Polyangiaceae bacterium]